MKTTSVFVLLMFFFCAHSFAAVKGAPALATEGIFAVFGADRVKSSEVIREKFTFISEDVAKKLHISKTQMESYNRELDQLNEMMSEVSHELEVMKKPTIEDAVSLWSGLKGAVSTTTLEAIQKITKGN